MVKLKIKNKVYNYEKSSRADKKLSVVVNGRTIHFGQSSMQHFYDKTRIWKSKDHLDKERRKNYRARASGIKNKEGKLTYLDPNSPNFHSYNVLW